jgi:hypothetical protein
MAICRDRLLKQRRDILEQIANNPKADDYKARVAAHHLAAEIAAVAFKVYNEGPGILAARHQYPRTSLTGPGTTGLRLELKKNKEKEEGEGEDNNNNNNSNPLAFTKETYAKSQKNKEKIIREQQQEQEEQEEEEEEEKEKE